MKKALILILIFLLSIGSVSALEFESYVDEAFKSGIITGDENGDFHSEKVAIRAEFATIVVRFLGLSGGVNIFSDVSDNDWFAGSISAAALHGMIAGYENAQARPYEPITCQDAVTMLGRYYNARKETVPPIDGVFDYALPYYAYALENDFFQREEYAEPTHHITKGEILALMYEYSKQDNKKIHFLSGYPKISEQGVFNSISLDLKTNEPCSIYYSLSATSSPAPKADTYLCEITEKNTVGSIHITVPMDNEYTLFLRPVDKNGVSGKITAINNLRAFPFLSGNGTTDAPYIIFSENQLEAISQYPDRVYKLGSDIVLSKPWTPIKSFSGILDGNGCSIKNLNISESITDAGLFAVIDSGTVRNLTVYANINVKMNAGAIAGQNINGTIRSCSVMGTVSAKTNNAGGICGINRGIIRDCLSAMYSVSADSFAGGICGQNYTFIEQCLSAAESVVSQLCAGGISGTNSGGKIYSCVAANMTVYNSMTYNSGVITTNKQNGVVDSCYSYEDVITNASYETPGRFSQSGIPISFEDLISVKFYQSIGFSNWNTAKNGFRLPRPDKASDPVLEKGLTQYMPLPISTPSELYNMGKNEAGHYILTQNITLTTPWKTIFTQNGFSGTFDGNGYTIKNLKLGSEQGMFSNITGGTVKNLNIENASASTSVSGGILTACNYGYIINCSISGNIVTKKAGVLGAFTAENYGEISGCTAKVNITNNDDNSTTGGICGENNGVVFNTFFSGKITSSGKNVVIGGISGYCTEGYISDSFADVSAKLDNTSSYFGGICGVASGAQIYKCASSGSVTQMGQNTYTGGICGAADASSVYNCLSAAELYIGASSAYTGGICGFNSASNIQNTYSNGSIVAIGTDEVFTGGICGYSENGFVMQNVSLNPSINSSGNAGAVIGYQELSEINDNYCCERTLINSSRAVSSIKNGIAKPITTLKSADFYLRPISDGGLLGWDDTGEIWAATSKVTRYPFPVLNGVDQCQSIKTPAYK